MRWSGGGQRLTWTRTYTNSPQDNHFIMLMISLPNSSSSSSPLLCYSLVVNSSRSPRSMNHKHKCMRLKWDSQRLLELTMASGVLGVCCVQTMVIIRISNIHLSVPVSSAGSAKRCCWNSDFLSSFVLVPCDWHIITTAVLIFKPRAAHTTHLHVTWSIAEMWAICSAH